mgnify:CR=1 FL=1
MCIRDRYRKVDPGLLRRESGAFQGLQKSIDKVRSNARDGGGIDRDPRGVRSKLAEEIVQRERPGIQRPTREAPKVRAVHQREMQVTIANREREKWVRR